MLAKRFDHFDHARSAEEMTMTPQSFHQAWRRIVWPSDRREERVTICARQNHALMLVEKPARSLIGKLAGGKTGDRHGLLDHLLCRRRKTQFEPLGFVFPLRRYGLLPRGRHDHSPQRLVRHFAVLTIDAIHRRSGPIAGG